MAARCRKSTSFTSAISSSTPSMPSSSSLPMKLRKRSELSRDQSISKARAVSESGVKKLRPSDSCFRGAKMDSSSSTVVSQGVSSAVSPSSGCTSTSGVGSTILRAPSCKISRGMVPYQTSGDETGSVWKLGDGAPRKMDCASFGRSRRVGTGAGGKAGRLSRWSEPSPSGGNGNMSRSACRQLRRVGR
eukprot:scaffold91333_cov23-Tisochrysis_lutea.AAC.2